MQLDKLKKLLKWYFCDSAVVLGQRSNYYTILNTAYGSTPATTNEGLIGSLRNIRKHRLLHQALLSLTRTQIRYLYALYLDEYQAKYPLIIKQVFNEKTGLALCLSPDRDGKALHHLLDLCIKHRHQGLQPQEQRELQQLIERTEQLYDKLHQQLQYLPPIVELNAIHH